MLVYMLLKQDVQPCQYVGLYTAACLELPRIEAFRIIQQDIKLRDDNVLRMCIDVLPVLVLDVFQDILHYVPLHVGYVQGFPHVVGKEFQPADFCA